MRPDAAVSHSHAAAQHIVAFREGVLSPERLEFVEFAQAQAVGTDGGQGEMAEVLRGLDGAVAVVFEDEASFFRGFTRP